MTPQEVLAKAAEAMSQRGKATGTYESTKDDPHFGVKGSVCAFGAMSLAATNMQSSCFAELGMYGNGEAVTAKGLVNQAAELLARHIEGHNGFLLEPFAKITHFNDHSSAEDVILAMKRAAHE